MKSLCSVCGKEGILEKRGNSTRIIHYSWVDGKRIFAKHTVDMGTDGNRMGTTMGTERAENSLILENMAPSKGFGPLTDWLTASRSTGLSHDGAI